MSEKHRGIDFLIQFAVELIMKYRATTCLRAVISSLNLQLITMLTRVNCSLISFASKRAMMTPLCLRHLESLLNLVLKVLEDFLSCGPNLTIFSYKRGALHTLRACYLSYYYHLLQQKKLATDHHDAGSLARLMIPIN
jgi:hypothetical protein